MLPHFPNRKKLYIMNFILLFENLIIEKQGDLTLIIEKRWFDLNGQTFMLRIATLGHRDGYSLKKKKMRNIIP